MKFTIPGRPITKKNSMRILRNPKTGAAFLAASKQYIAYQESAGYYIPCKWAMIDRPVNIKCIYYMPTRGKVDLVNLLEATCDILVRYGVLVDDNCDIVASHDGSRRLFDKQNPRVEIEIEDIEYDRA